MISNTGPISAAFAQLQRQQAERSAEQAEQRARSLQAETREARADAERAQERARTLELETDQATQEAGRARSGLTANRALQQLDTQFGELRSSIATAFPPAEAGPAPAAPAPRPVVNAQGEVTGTVINVEA